MKYPATTGTALATGVYCSVVLFVLGPLIDAKGPSSSAWLLVGALAVGIPAYFCVFGVTREEMVGLWVLQPALLKRVAACFLGAISTATLAWLLVGIAGLAKA